MLQIAEAKCGIVVHGGSDSEQHCGMSGLALSEQQTARFLPSLDVLSPLGRPEIRGGKRTVV